MLLLNLSLEMLQMLRMLMLMLMILCAQFVCQDRFEHRVSKKVSYYPSVFRIDEHFSRGFASVVAKGDHSINISSKNWVIKKYIKPDNNYRENLNIKTVVTLSDNHQVHIGKEKQIELNLVTFESNKMMILESPVSNELVELIPMQSHQKITQEVTAKNSAPIKVSVLEQFPGQEKRVNGIEVADLELVFVQARIPKVSKKPLYNNAITGHLSLSNGEINSGELIFDDLLKIGAFPIMSMELNYVSIKNGGAISFEYTDKMISGIFSKAGNETYILRIATGPLSGASFTFATSGADIMRKTEAILTKANEEQERLVKERSFASKKAHERSSYSF